jgi:hypothetical protein
MPFCEQCGARLAGGASACGFCGHADAGEPGVTPLAPPPPPGYSLRREPIPAPQPGAAPVSAASVVPAVKPGFPAVAVPPLAAVIALFVTTVYATVHELIKWGNIGSADWFLTGAAPGVLRSPFIGYSSVDEWFSYGSFGGGWVIAIPLVTLVLTTALLASLTRTGIGQRLAIGCLVFLPMVLFTILLTLLNYAVIGADYFYFGSLGEILAKGAAGAAIVGLLGGLPGALLSLAIRPPARSTGWG